MVPTNPNTPSHRTGRTTCPATAADVLARRLAEAGCRRAFGMPGGEVLTVLDALRGAGIAFHLAAHENAGGFMAEGGHHVDGAPALLVTTLGPGALNSVNVVANAWQDRVPMIVLVGTVDPDTALSYTHQVVDHRAVFAPVTKATFTLSAASADLVAEKALAIANDPRPGPVLIEIPMGVAGAPAGPRGPRRVRPAAVAPAGADLAEARSWLQGAERPLIVAGLDMLEDGGAASLGRMVDRLGWPVVTTYKAKGLVDESRSEALGGAGLSPRADAILTPLLASADVILCAGYDPIEMRQGWHAPWDPTRQRVIDLQAAPNHHYMHHATASFTGPPGPALDALTDGVAPRPVWTGGEIARTRDALALAFADDAEWGPAAIVADARSAFPPDAIATVDSGAHRILLSQMWRCALPRTLLQSTGFCTMGCALPLAIGAKIAAPTREVVAFTGDAGLLMVAGELATLARLGLSLAIVVFVDARLSLIDLKQRQRGLAACGVVLDRHDYAALARTFGGTGLRVRDRTALRAALARARESPAFTLIAAEFDGDLYEDCF